MKRLVVLVGALIVLGLVGAAFARPDAPAPRPSDTPTAEGDAAHHVPKSSERTVLVGASAKVGSDDGTLRVGHESGARAPAKLTSAVVTSDENCTPDAQGVSHCRNNLRMANGRTIRIQHDHRMHEVPCLVPGERVNLRAA